MVQQLQQAEQGLAELMPQADLLLVLLLPSFLSLKVAWQAQLRGLSSISACCC